MFELHWFELIGVILLSVLFGVYLKVTFKHIKNMSNEYDGGEP